MVGHRMNNRNREISYEEAVSIADGWGMKYMEIDAKFDRNVEQLFTFIAEEIIQNLENEVYGTNPYYFEKSGIMVMEKEYWEKTYRNQR